jgi:hypothetical protein
MSCSTTSGPSGLQHSSSAASPEAPCDVYYVVQTLGTKLGEPENRLSSALYETRSQAQAELTRLTGVHPGRAYSVWKGATYIQPARWAHDVVLIDGTVLRANESSRGARP